MDKLITEEKVEGIEGKEEDHDHDEPPKKNKVIRNKTLKNHLIGIVKAPPNENDVTENINKLSISDENDEVYSEKINTFYSKSGNHMFQYSNKKTPFENACPWFIPMVNVGPGKK